LRAMGRGTRWMVLKAWEKTSDNEKATLGQLFSLNSKLARAYQVADELRAVLKASDDMAMAEGWSEPALRTARLRDHANAWLSKSYHYVTPRRFGSPRIPTKSPFFAIHATSVTESAGCHHCLTASYQEFAQCPNEAPNVDRRAVLAELSALATGIRQ
jgi:hypothetical protein